MGKSKKGTKVPKGTAAGAAAPTTTTTTTTTTTNEAPSFVWQPHMAAATSTKRQAKVEVAIATTAGTLRAALNSALGAGNFDLSAADSYLAVRAAVPGKGGTFGAVAYYHEIERPSGCSCRCLYASAKSAAMAALQAYAADSGRKVEYSGSKAYVALRDTTLEAFAAAVAAYVGK